MIDRQKQNLRKSDIHGEEASELKSTPQIHAPHPETSHATEVDTEEEGAGIDIAARWLLDAQAILVFCGATVSVPVGQTRRHGIHKQLEPLVEQYGVSLEQALSEDWFQQDPYLAWGFLLRAMRSLEKYTHQGFSAVRGWFDLVPCGGIVVTEEQDGSWHRSGLTHPGACLYVHSILPWLRCTANCGENWLAEFGKNWFLVEHPDGLKAEGKLPRCGKCGGLGWTTANLTRDFEPWRHDMFKHFLGWGHRADTWVQKHSKLTQTTSFIAVIEINFDEDDAVMQKIRDIASECNNTRFICIDAAGPRPPSIQRERHCLVELDAEPALLSIDQRISAMRKKDGSVQGPLMKFRTWDATSRFREVHCSADTPLQRILDQALFEGDWEGDYPSAKIPGAGDTSMSRSNPVPQNFVSRTQSGETVVNLSLRGGCFQHARNAHELPEPERDAAAGMVSEAKEPDQKPASCTGSPLETPEEPSESETKCQPQQTTIKVKLLTKEQVQEVVGKNVNKVNLPLEHRLWTLKELELYVMSGGQIQPKCCSIPSESSLVNNVMTDDQVQIALRRAADWLSKADAILVGSGAGMGVSSGLATFRGGQSGVWPAFEKLDLSYEELCEPGWFTKEPHLAWGFWAFQHRTYRDTVPHQGYETVRQWATRTCCGGFSFTSNIDRHWHKSCWPSNRLLECHGSVNWLQCSIPCSEEVWDAPSDLDLAEDPQTHRAVGELPRCKNCNACARPCIHMFGNDTGWSQQRRRVQATEYGQWRRCVSEMCDSVHDALVICLEIGCGVTVPTVRNEIRRVMTSRNVRLIRINPENPGVPKEIAEASVSLPLGAAQALSRLNELMGSRETARFLVVDDVENAVEVELPRYSTIERVVFCAQSEVGYEKFGNPHYTAENIYSGSFEEVNFGSSLSDNMFFLANGNTAPPLTRVWVRNVRFKKSNASSEARVVKVESWLQEMISTYETLAYQTALRKVEDKPSLYELIRGVHAKVLPKYGLGIDEHANLKQIISAQGRMKAITTAARYKTHINKLADYTQISSGAAHAGHLPARRTVPK